MKLGERVIDTKTPGIYGIYQGQCITGGKPYARVKFGHKYVSIPIDRVKSASPRGPKPVTLEDFKAIQDRYGYDADKVRALAKGHGVTLRQAVDELLECEEGCDCKSCKEVDHV